MLVHIVELLDHLGDDRNHQQRDDNDRDQRQHRRIGQRADQLAAQFRLPLEQVGQPFGDIGQGAGAFAGGDHRPVERRKALRLAAHRLGQALPLDHPAMDGGNPLLDMRLFILVADQPQRFLQRADLRQRRELPREQGEFLGREFFRAE